MAEGGGGGAPIVPLDAQSIKELDAQIEQLMKCQVRDDETTAGASGALSARAPPPPPPLARPAPLT